MSSVIVGSRCMTASSSNDEPSQDGLFHRLRGWPPLGAATTVEGPCLTGQHAGASGGLRPVVLSSLPRPEPQYHRSTGSRTGVSIQISAGLMQSPTPS